ncbi:MAG: hypothetical protein ACI30D_00050 [Muribaculaceae bacterium]
MKKLTKAILAATLLAVGMPAVAANVDQANGTASDGTYSWEYWNDKKDDGAIWPNWKLVFTPELDATPANVAFNYSLKKGDVEVKAGAAKTSGTSTTQATAYTGPITDLEDGDYTMYTTVTLIKAGTTDPIITTFTNNFTYETVEQEYNFTFNHTEVIDGTTVTINYEFVEDNGKEIPADATYAVRLGIIGPGDKTADTRTGSIVFDQGLNPNTTYHVYTNNPSVTIDGVRYVAKAPEFDITTGAAAVDPDDYSFTFAHTETVTENSLTVNYDFVEASGKEIPADAVYAVQLGFTGDGIANTDKTADTKSGAITLDNLLSGTTYTVWTNSPSVTINGKKYVAAVDANYTVTTKKAEGDTPTISLVVTEPTATGKTTGTLKYAITTDSPDVEGVKYHIYAVTEGDVKLGEIAETTELNGTLELTNLKNLAVTNIWVKAQGTLPNGQTTNEAQYPGEAQGWTGLSIDTSSFAGDDDVIMPSISITASNATYTGFENGEACGTVDYEVNLSSTKGFQSLKIYVVTNAFGNGDKVLAQLDATTDLAGTLNMAGLKPGAKNELWVKATITLTDGQVSDEVVYPGAAQGWTGLSVQVPSEEGGVVIPNVTLTASNPTYTGVEDNQACGTLDYEVTLSNTEFFKSLRIYVVTNAFGNGDVVLDEIAETTELTGTLHMKGLKPDATNGLWVKAVVTLTDDSKTDEVTYPGAAQGWTGLEIAVPAIEVALDAIDADNNEPVEYFNLQGVRVANPANGLYIRRQGNKVSKIRL